ncbi:hypothetical protein D7X87_25750 [bacterium D16-54]|nr:hypothetical protein D7X87_25750 [bacterium D16-54]RKJ09199.1 hypothetical protein D7X65_25775 [bacterium D16-56]
MKVSKKTIIIMLVICVIVLGVSFILEYINYDAEIANQMHIDFYKNLCLGMFASGLLVLIPAIVQYNTEKSNFYIEMYRYLDSLLYNTLDIISVMEKYDRDARISKMFDEFGITYNKVVSLYSTFSCFFTLSKKDRLIESVINETTKFMMIQEELLNLSKKLKVKEISEGEYAECFEVVRTEIIKTYQDKFILYRRYIEKNMKSLLENRELKTYTNL